MNLSIDRLADLRTTLLNRLGPDMARVPRSMAASIRLCPKMRSTAGRAHYNTMSISMNLRLLTDHPHHIDQTLAHELAHLVAFELYGSKATGHGRHWQSIMQRFGYSADRCHKLDASKYKRTHKPCALAKCGCRDNIEIKAKRFKRMINGAKYRCTDCRQRLVLIFDKPTIVFEGKLYE
jgi:SprT protein